MPLAKLKVSRIQKAAEKLDELDPDRTLKDPVNMAIRLSAAQNAAGTSVNVGAEMVARIDELLATPPKPADEPAANEPTDAEPGDLDELDAYN